MKKETIVDIIVFAFIFILFFSFFEPSLLFSLTTTTGGDTGSHYPTAVYLKEVLLPHGQIMGWDPGNYAGYPLFYHYFPITFLIMAFASFVIPMQIAFKLVSVLGIFLLPVCAYFAFKLLKYPFPIPAIAAVFTLPFLFMEANSMWGGNIPSTLAGEYSYAFSLAIFVLFFGSLYNGVNNKKNTIWNSLLIVLMALSHGYTFILSGVVGLFFLFGVGQPLVGCRNYSKGQALALHFATLKANFKYLFKVFSLAGLLIAFWFLPFIRTLPYVTEYVTRWHIGSILEVIPLVLVPFAGLFAAAAFLNYKEKQSHYFFYFLGICFLLYILAPNIGMLDIRLIPFLQLFTLLFAATLPLKFLDQINSKQLLPVIVFLAVIIWVLPQVTFIKGWIKWNYEGFEGKKAWPIYKEINDYLKTSGTGRVVYEHSPAHNVFGTERAFENLPYFAKRETLEGLYMQSSISSPFVFYIQSEISKVCSGPFPQYTYSTLNIKQALPHLKIFNVTEYIVRSEDAKKQAALIPELKLEKTVGDYQIYKLLNNDGRYVVPLEYEPVLFETTNWKKDFFDWFKYSDPENLVYIKNPTKEDLLRFKVSSKDLDDLALVKQPLPAFKIKESVKNQEISFDTNLIGYPHLIKISYHPNWQVEGEDKIYLVSPSFMLVYPTQSHVRLYFGKTIFNYIGEFLTYIGLLILMASGIIYLINARKSVNHNPRI